MKKTLTKRALSFVLALTLLFSAAAFAISADAPTAADFNNAVAELKSAATLAAKEAALENATDILDAYKANGGDETDADIKDSYEYYETAKAEIEEKIASCNAFIEAVSAALDETAPYLTIREMLNVAKELKESGKIDEDYGSVGLHEEFRLELENKLSSFNGPETVCAKYVDYAAKAAAATTWEEADEYVTLATAAKNAISNFDYPLELDGYPGYSEADKNIKKAKEFMDAQVLAAIPFCEAVKNITKAKSIPIGVAAAYEVLKTTDATAENAVIALANLQKAERSYNRSAKSANAAVNEITELCFAILF